MKPYAIEDDFDKVLVNGLAMRAYLVYCPHEAESDVLSVLVYAQSEVLACVIGCGDLGGDPEQCVAEHRPQDDARAGMFLAGRLEEDPVYLRSSGWRMEGESVCASCGLGAFGMEAFGVCRSTGLCKECGCGDAEDDKTGPCMHEDGFSCD